MSFIVKGIDMPETEYEEVIIRIKHTGEVCNALNIHLYAQAIQIPKEHGRLIDGDELERYVEDKGFVLAHKAIDEQNVILEAEG